MTTAVIYTNGSQECERVTQLLKSTGGEFLEYRLNSHFTQKSFEREFGPDATYPQVAIGAKHIGNLKETLRHMKERGIIQ
tara:strand:- start:267 stop:506 length:240 start_codon:yes stop_codon:yes gene_type:complete